jgi:hypothetical protein
MIRLLSLFALCTLGPALAIAEPVQMPSCCMPSVVPPAQSTTTSAGKQTSKEKLGQELLAIINKTESVDTFVVTLEVMLVADIDPAVAIPAIIRNAERLELLSGLSKGEGQDKVQECVSDALKHFCEKCGGGRKSNACYSSARGGLTGGAIDYPTGVHEGPPPTPSIPLPTQNSSFRIPLPR